MFKRRTQWLKTWEGKYLREHGRSVSHEGFYLNQQKQQNKQAWIWGGFFFLRQESMDVCRWAGVTREDSTKWKGLNATLKKKKKNQTFIQWAIKSYLKAFKEWSSKTSSMAQERGEITSGIWCSHCEIGADAKHLKMCQVSAKSKSTLYPHLYFLVTCYSKMLWLTHHRFLGSSESLIFFIGMILWRATFNTTVLLYFPFSDY